LCQKFGYNELGGYELCIKYNWVVEAMKDRKNLVVRKCSPKLDNILDLYENWFVSSWIVDLHCSEVSSHLKLISIIYAKPKLDMVIFKESWGGLES